MKSLSPSWNISSRSARVRLFRKFSGSSSDHRSTNFSIVRDQGEWKAGSQLISSFSSDWAPSTLGGNTQIQGHFSLLWLRLCVNILEDTPRSVPFRSSKPCHSGSEELCWGTSLSSSFSSCGLYFLLNLQWLILIVH